MNRSFYLSTFQSLKVFLLTPIYFDISTLSFHSNNNFKPITYSKNSPRKYRFAVAWFSATHLFIFIFWKLGFRSLRSLPDGAYSQLCWNMVTVLPFIICLFFVLFWIKTNYSITWIQSLEKLGYKKPDKKQLQVCSLLVLLIVFGYSVYIAINLRMGVPVAVIPNWPSHLFILIFVAGIFEETFFRGFLFQFLRPGRTFVSAALLSGLLWSLGHLLNLEAGITKEIAYRTFGSMTTATLLMITLAYIFERGKNVIWGGMIVHLFIDSFIFLNIGQYKTTYYFDVLNVFRGGTIWVLAVVTIPLVSRMIPAKGKKKTLVQMIEAFLNPTQKKRVNISRRWFWFGSVVGFSLTFTFLCFFAIYFTAHQALTKFKNTPEVELVQMAGNYFLNQEYEKSRIAYEIVLDKNPNDYCAHYFLGSLYSQYLWPMDYKKAAFHVQKALNLRMTKDNLLFLGWVLYMDDQLQESEKTFQGYLNKNGFGKDPNAWEDLGIVLMKESKKQEAQKAFETVLAVDPNFKDRERIEQEIKNPLKETNLEMEKYILFPEQ